MRHIETIVWISVHFASPAESSLSSQAYYPHAASDWTSLVHLEGILTRTWPKFSLRAEMTYTDPMNPMRDEAAVMPPLLEPDILTWLTDRGSLEE